MISRYLIGSLVILLTAATISGLFYRGNAAKATAARDAAVTAMQAAEAERDNLRDVLNTERIRADRMTVIAEQYEQDKINAQLKADSVIADLKSGAVRLQDKWAGCPDPYMPGIDARPSQPNAAEQSRIESAGRAIAAAASCDAQVAGLQAIVTGDRQ